MLPHTTVSRSVSGSASVSPTLPQRAAASASASPLHPATARSRPVSYSVRVSFSMPDCVSQSSTVILLPEFTGAGGVAPVMTSTGSFICFSSSAGM